MDRLKNTLASARLPIVLPVFSVFVLFFGASCRPLFPREVSSAVLAIEGSAAGTFAGQTTRLTPNEWLLPGTKIATAPESRLDLMLLPGILVELAGATEIEITRLRFARDGDETLRPMQAREASLRLLRGTLVVAIGQSQMRSRIFIESPAGDLTAFDLRTFKIWLEGGSARVMSVRGKVNFKPAGATAPVTIEPGILPNGPRPNANRGPRRRLISISRRRFRRCCRWKSGSFVSRKVLASVSDRGCGNRERRKNC